MRIFVAALVLLIGMGSQPKAEANLVTGTNLHEWCNDKDKFAMCLGYVLGEVDVMDGEKYHNFCFKTPVGVTRQQLASIVKGWLKKRPDAHHFPAKLLVANALDEIWPCK